MPSGAQLIKTWRDIPGFFDFEDIYDQAVGEAKDGDILVEVGSFLGKSAAYMAQRIKESGKDLLFLVVDSWDKGEYAKWWIDVCQNPPAPWPVEELYGKPLENAFWYCMESVGNPYQKALAMSSVDAARNFKDSSVGFVFIDADHRYESVSADIKAWMPKVKKGGILAGHDYRTRSWPDVTRAVDEEFGPTVEHRNNSWLVRM